MATSGRSGTESSPNACVGATTGIPGLDKVLQGICPGDNLVWGVDNREDYLRLVVPYERAAREAGRRVVYFRYGPAEPLFEESHEALDVFPMNPEAGFEAFVRSIHAVIEQFGIGEVYIFDSLSALADAWMSD